MGKQKKYLKILALAVLIPLWSSGCGMMGGKATEEQERRIVELEERARELEASLVIEKEKLKAAKEKLQQQSDGGGKGPSTTSAN